MEGKPHLTVTASPGDGKLSVHGSGVAHIQSHDSPGDNRLVVSGNFLGNASVGTLGVRHLFTVLIAGPSHLPSSLAFNRKSDYSVRAAQLMPYVLVFWAVPATSKLEVSVQAAFHVDDLESVPPELGLGALTLSIHAVVWFAYRTKHMHRWPAHPQVCYHDGYLVPLLIGTSTGAYRLELRKPSYALSQSKLYVSI